MVQVDFVYYGPLAVLVQIGKLHRRTHFNFALVHKVKKLRHKVCQADIPANLVLAFANLLTEFLTSCFRLLCHWHRS